MEGNWIEVELKSLGEIITGGTPSKKDQTYYNSNDYPFFKPTDLNQGINTSESNDHLSEKAYLNSRKAPKNSILVTCIGATIGKTGLIKKEGAFNQQINAIIPFEFVDNKFLFYQILSQEFQNRIKDSSSSTTLPILNKSKFSILPSKLASLPEQRAIVARIEELFSELDHAVSSLQSAQTKLEIYRQAVLKKAFEGGFTNSDSIKWVELGSVCDNVEYGSSNKSEDSGLVPVLRMGNIQNGKFDWNDLKYSNSQDEINKYRLKKGDVLFNRTNSPEHVGKTAIFKGEREAIFAGYLIRINYKEGLLVGDYLCYFLNSHTAKQFGDSVKSFGVNQSNINGTKLKKYPFPLTSIDEQTQIVQEIESRLSVADKLAETIQTNLQKSEALRQSILKKAFEGRLLSEAELEACRKEADWEPAERLLERIKKEKSKPKK